MARKLKEEYEAWSQVRNIQKIEYLCIYSDQIEIINIQSSKEYKYLGVTFDQKNYQMIH